MDIDEALLLLEREHVKADIEALTPRDRLNFWASLKEFDRPKLQRSVFEQAKNDDIKILIEYGDNKTTSHESVSIPLGESE